MNNSSPYLIESNISISLKDEKINPSRIYYLIVAEREYEIGDVVQAWMHLLLVIVAWLSIVNIRQSDKDELRQLKQPIYKFESLNEILIIILFYLEYKK